MARKTIHPDGRVCTKCRQFKAWSDFYRQAIGLNGKNSRCKKCCNKIHNEWTVANRDKVKVINRVQYIANSGKRKSYQNAYRAANRERTKVALQRWASSHLEWYRNSNQRRRALKQAII